MSCRSLSVCRSRSSLPGSSTAESSSLPDFCACRVRNGRVSRVISRSRASHSRSVRVTPSSATGESPGRRSAPSTASTTSGGFSCHTPRASPGWYLRPEPSSEISMCRTSFEPALPVIRWFATTRASNGCSRSYRGAAGTLRRRVTVATWGPPTASRAPVTTWSSHGAASRSKSTSHSTRGSRRRAPRAASRSSTWRPVSQNFG